MLARTAHRLAGLLFALSIPIIAIGVYVGLVYSANVDAGASYVVTFDFGVWIAGLTTSLGLILVFLLMLFMVPVREHAEAKAAAPALEPVEVTCASCAQAFAIEDSGQRPLQGECPHCGTLNEVMAPEAAAVHAEPEPAAPGSGQVPAPVVERDVGGQSRRFLVLRCGSCQTQFEAPYSEARPLVTTCTNCGRRGILRW